MLMNTESTHDRKLFRIIHIAIKCCLKCNLSQFENHHFQTFLGEHPLDPLQGPKTLFWAVIVVLEKYLRLGTVWYFCTNSSTKHNMSRCMLTSRMRSFALVEQKL